MNWIALISMIALAQRPTGERPINTIQVRPVEIRDLTGELPLRFEGKLLPTDPIWAKVKGVHQVFRVKLEQGKGYVFSASSADFDTLLGIQSAEGKLLHFDDDSGGGTNSRFAYRPERDGEHRIVIATFNGKVGAYHLEVRLQTGDETDIDKAKSLEDEAKKLLDVEKFAAAESLYRKAAELRLKSQGEENPWTLFTLHQLAFTLASERKFAEAEAVGRKVYELRRKLIGPTHRETIRSLQNLAYAVVMQYRAAEAEGLMREALSLLRKSLGPEHPDTLRGIHDLAWNLCEDQKRHADAETLNREVAELRAKVLGKDHPMTAVSLNNLAQSIRRQGRYAEAEVLDRQVLALRLRILAPESQGVAVSLHNLSEDLTLQGKYAEAESYLRRALAMMRKLRGDEDTDSVVALVGLGLNLVKQGRLADAEGIFREALALRRKIFGVDHPTYALALTHLAIALQNQRKYDDAEAPLREALKIHTKHLGAEHPDTLIVMNNLAFGLEYQGKSEESQALYREGLELCLKRFGELHLQTATSLNNLAFVVGYGGKPDQGEELFRRALAVRLKILGPHHHETATLQRAFANFLYDFGKFDDAEPLVLASVETFERARLEASFLGMDRVNFNNSITPFPLAAASLIRAGKGEQAWELLERNRARGLFDDLAAQSRRNLSAEERQREQDLLRRLDALSRKIRESQASKNPDSTELIRLRDEKDKALSDLVTLQAELASKHGPAAGQVYDWTKLRASLPPNAAYITWLRMPGAIKGTQPGGDHWAALLRSSGPPVWVRLMGSGEQGAWLPSDDALLDQVRKELQFPNPNVDPQTMLSKLARQRLGPLEPHLKDVKHLIVLPSLAMAGIPLEALTSQYRVSYAPSATVFAWLGEGKTAPAKNDLLALGDPTFPAAPQQVKKAELLQVMRGLAPKPLPCTRAEVEAIAQLIQSRGGKADTLLGQQASERGLERLLLDDNLTRYRYVHLATHGHPNASQGANSYLALTPENPDLFPEGRLTAEQMLRNWKLNADLVTLSACSSGLGQQAGGEGYVGFAQSLFLAGARSLVLSQWQVNDYATSLFMVRFYQNLLGQRTGLQGAMSKLEALREAREWMRTLTHDEAAKLVRRLPNGDREIARWEDEEHPYAHPNYWSAFILVGAP